MFPFLFLISLLPVVISSLLSCCGDKDESQKSSAVRPVQGAPKRTVTPGAKKPAHQKSGQNLSSEQANQKDPSDVSKVSAVQSAPTPTKEGEESKDKKESKPTTKDSQVEEKGDKKESKIETKDDAKKEGEPKDDGKKEVESKDDGKKEEPKKAEEVPVEETQLDTLVEKRLPKEKVDSQEAKHTAEEGDGGGKSNKMVRSKRSMETMAAIWDHDFI